MDHRLYTKIVFIGSLFLKKSVVIQIHKPTFAGSTFYKNWNFLNVQHFSTNVGNIMEATKMDMDVLEVFFSIIISCLLDIQDTRIHSFHYKTFSDYYGWNYTRNFEMDFIISLSLEGAQSLFMRKWKQHLCKFNFEKCQEWTVVEHEDCLFSGLFQLSEKSDRNWENWFKKNQSSSNMCNGVTLKGCTPSYLTYLHTFY